MILLKKISTLLTLIFIGSFSLSAQNCSVNSDIDLNICANQTMTLNGSTGGLFKSPSDLVWTQIGGPSVLIDDSNSAITTVTGFSAGNSYTFRLSATPRTNLDVVATGGWGTPVAIFATQAQSNSYTAGNGASASFTRHLSVVPNCRQYSFNAISQAGDVGLFFTDGFGKNAAAVDNGSNLGAGLVIAPWSTDKSKGGLRIGNDGNVEVRGEIRTIKVRLDAKWWPDYVFSDKYNLPSLENVASFIQDNKHLPDMPSESEVIENGQDLGNMQTLQQQKIEELTLYTIKQNEQIKEQQKKLEEQEVRLTKLEAFLLDK